MEKLSEAVRHVIGEPRNYVGFQSVELELPVDTRQAQEQHNAAVARAEAQAAQTARAAVVVAQREALAAKVAAIEDTCARRQVQVRLTDESSM